MKTIDKHPRPVEEFKTDAEKEFERLFNSPDFLAACQRMGWGKLELVVKGGKPIVLSVRHDIKMS